MSRVYTVVLLAAAAALAFAGCGGGSGSGTIQEEYLIEISDIAVRAGELGNLLAVIELGDDAAASYAEELEGLQQRGEDLGPPEAVRDAHESFVEGLRGLADGARLTETAIESGDEDGLASAKAVVNESRRSIFDALVVIRQSESAQSAPAD